MAQGTTDFATQLQLFGGQYQYSWGIRGDNTLEHAKYLGYLDAKELYPDLKPREFQDYVQAVVDGTAPKVWEASQDWGNWEVGLNLSICFFLLLWHIHVIKIL